MHFTDEKLNKISNRLKITKLNANYFAMMYTEYNNERFLNRFFRMKECLDYWFWDEYKINKVLDLQKVNCCKDRFCPNCRSIAINRNIVKFSPHFKRMIEKGYNPYLMTLTIPNVLGKDLKNTVNKLNKAFTKFWRWLGKDVGRKGGYKDRLFYIPALIKVLEITVQKNNNNMYHPHFHLLAFLDNEESENFKKYIDGGFQRNTQSNIFYSDADIHIMKLWYMAYNNISIRNYYKISNNWFDLYICDVREMDSITGIYEVFKYSFKDSDIRNYNNFKVIFDSIDGKRLRQGYGELYNIKIDDEDVEDGEEYESIKDYLLIDEKEEPQQQVTKAIRELTTVYQEYKKISRFRNWKDIDKIN